MVKNVVELNINKKVYDLICRRIKSKSHLIQLLAEISSLIISNIPVKNNKYGKCIIRLENKRRIYFSINDAKSNVNKHFSFNFPFNISEENGLLKLETMHRSIEIHSHHIAVIRALCSNDGFDEKLCRHGILLDFTAFVASVFEDLGLSFDFYEKDINQILMELIMFEPGYIRFDNDEKNANGRIHPLNHLDIFYSQSTTFKLGCSLLELGKFIDILEPANECEFIGEHHVRQ
jgi:hypothetical protein